MDGNEDSEWQEASQYQPIRGSKRVVGDEEEYDDIQQSQRARDKRPRNISLDKPTEHMEVDDDEDDDEITELKSVVRGKKRDRAEAGSTFGGDDDDSAPENEDDAKARRRRRKRRTVSKRKSDAGSSLRGQKRDREMDGSASDYASDDDKMLRVSRKKRGKKAASQPRHDEDDEHRAPSDVSMDESQASTRSRHRRIGDEWESNGIKYKIGLNGQRLRQALVKKARQKFTMVRKH